MGKKTESVDKTYTNQFGWQPVPNTPDINAWRDFRPQMDPTIGFRAGSAKRQLQNTFSNPMGGYTTPQIRDATLRSGFRGIDEQAGMESRAGQFDVNQQRMGQLGSLAALTQPRLTQTGGTESAKYGSPKLGDILGAAVQVGAGALGGPIGAGLAGAMFGAKKA